MTVALSALPALALLLVHLFGARGLFERFGHGAWLSFAGGAAAAYVFLYLLPILNEISSELSAEDGRWPGGEWIFVAALSGTCVFHVVEVLARRGENRRSANGDLRFWTQLAAFALYNLLVGILFVLKPYANPLDALLYQSALILHFAVVDSTLRERHPRTYDRYGRWIMAAALALGWCLGHVGVPNMGAMGAAFAFLAGGMILNVLKEELAVTDRGSLAPFVLGSALFAALFLFARMT